MNELELSAIALLLGVITGLILPSRILFKNFPNKKDGIRGSHTSE